MAICINSIPVWASMNFDLFLMSFYDVRITNHMVSVGVKVLSSVSSFHSTQCEMICKTTKMFIDNKQHDTVFACLKNALHNFASNNLFLNYFWYCVSF